MYTSTYEGHISEDFDNGDNRNYCANSRQFSVSSLLRLGNKRRASDADSGEGRQRKVCDIELTGRFS
ncbi:unnamed protein product [Acanthoscelides obtectus]|uniref:Uncharacterized protein n=1 Tax=Acanthoscelides obtectus TaxID=200917 RepID=A0A9P0KQ43_ACAOB|nr:unnamed protein product [Acanthoscelides obtectus]CAK1660603.1 hypothetical protein AOBTE_LOCUS22172 [Acanthoscelides obtectus]